MPTEKTIGITLIVATIALLTVWAVVKGLTNAIVRYLTTIGVPAGIAGQFGSIVFYGTLLGLIVLALKSVPRLSRV